MEIFKLQMNSISSINNSSKEYLGHKELGIILLILWLEKLVEAVKIQFYHLVQLIKPINLLLNVIMFQQKEDMANLVELTPPLVLLALCLTLDIWRNI